MYARRADPMAVKEWYRKQPAKLPKARLGHRCRGGIG